MDLNDCPCTGKTLARLVQPAVMAALAERPGHGYQIVQRLAEMSLYRSHRPDPTGVYRVLKSMERDGLLESAMEFNDNRPAKRCYRLTPAGRQCLVQWAGTLQEYQASVANLLLVITQVARPGAADEQSASRNDLCCPQTDCCGNASPS